MMWKATLNVNGTFKYKAVNHGSDSRTPDCHDSHVVTHPKVARFGRCWDARSRKAESHVMSWIRILRLRPPPAPSVLRQYSVPEEYSSASSASNAA